MPTQRLTELPDTVLRLIEKICGPVIDTGATERGARAGRPVMASAYPGR
ncbi:hypothetical protein ACFWWC_45110 [Streptomyces sp. NPDC058642]